MKKKKRKGKKWFDKPAKKQQQGAIMHILKVQ